MELRLLSTAEERQIFARNLVETRLAKGAGFCETGRSQVGEAHLAFGRLYGLFADESAGLDDMMAGLVMHDLASFPQSYPKPDLTHYPPESVLEFGELWAKIAGSARIIRQAGAILAGELHAQAVLAYPLFSPWNLSAAYHRDFDPAGSPIEWPYIRTTDGNRMFVQAMVSEGEKLARMIQDAGQWGFSADAELTRIIFNSPFKVARRRAEIRAQRVSTPEAAPMAARA
ncbi:MAG TPA: hypothetical protein VFB15_14525 [Candidatus Binataceae bacterium]|jgi:hypothetical protein|nr:hypothetical protein [Candidatus Binataceae bacterium]